ncbi:prepilin peptidase [Roseateles cellulosilyticus]|uniref:Prepilin leader peptidase/N-methyltransferase n=1 Tax=Pelomonas cellulosilytica TaxID=2906762 RepID=A0ABS8XJ16_9BURK|nr:A24 family peptidase [Pelomonas sp. P8]MCE4552849.1 A24 family peptidase [Pelomonas sp. P8]
MPSDSIDWSLWLSPWVLGALGLCIGSFLNVVIHRLPQMMEREWLSDTAEFLRDKAMLQRSLGASAQRAAEIEAFGERLGEDCAKLPKLTLSRPRSRCPHCGHVLAWHENLPVVGWLRLGGRCAACKARISMRYPVVEAATGALFAATAAVFGPTPMTLVYIAVIAIVLAAALIDLDTTVLPDGMNFAVIGLGLAAAWQHWTPVSLGDAALGVLFGYGALWAIATGYGKLRNRRAMGEGDFKLYAAFGALLGWQLLPPVLLLASAVGAIVGGYMVLRRDHDRSVPIPFGPYLAGGGLAAMFFGRELLELLYPLLLPA